MSERLKYTIGDDGLLTVKVEYEPADMGILRTIVSEIYPARELKIPREGITVDVMYYTSAPTKWLRRHAEMPIDAQITFNGGGQVVSLTIGGIEGTFCNATASDRYIILKNEEKNLTIHLMNDFYGHVYHPDEGAILHLRFYRPKIFFK